MTDFLDKSPRDLLLLTGFSTTTGGGRGGAATCGGSGTSAPHKSQLSPPAPVPPVIEDLPVDGMSDSGDGGGGNPGSGVVLTVVAARGGGAGFSFFPFLDLTGTAPDEETAAVLLVPAVVEVTLVVVPEAGVVVTEIVAVTTIAFGIVDVDVVVIVVEDGIRCVPGLGRVLV